jgi:hypothetical protein
LSVQGTGAHRLETDGELALVGDDEPARGEVQSIDVQVDGVVGLAIELDDSAAG